MDSGRLDAVKISKLIRKFMKRTVPLFRISFFILIASALFICCRHSEQRPAVDIISKNEKAVGVVIRGIDLRENEFAIRLKVQLVKTGERFPILGEFKSEGRDVIFEPLVPFTRGLSYEVLLDDSLLSEIHIPVGEFTSPQLLSIYPSQDTVPENLLKMYFEFSEPMVEGSSLRHVTLLRQDGDTMTGTFLDLQPELWNGDATVLTLWLDPGRIKRDLIPNKELGAPLEAGEHYTLQVSKLWQSKNGLPLTKDYTKTFVVGDRDDTSPALHLWKVLPPSFNKKQALEIQFRQPLDYYLAKECISIRHANGNVVAGTMEIDDEERSLSFMPDEPWKKDRFVLHIEGRLEDLSGNNLNRPFDRDVNKKSDVPEQEIFTKEFEIQ